MAVVFPSRAPDFTIDWPADGTYDAGTELAMGGGIVLSGLGFIVGTDDHGKYLQFVDGNPFQIDGVGTDQALDLPAVAGGVWVRLRVGFQAFAGLGANYFVGSGFAFGDPDDPQYAGVRVGQSGSSPAYQHFFEFDTKSAILHSSEPYFDYLIFRGAPSGNIIFGMHDPVDGSGFPQEYEQSYYSASEVPAAWPTSLGLRSNPFGPRIYAYDIWNGPDLPVSGLWLARQNQNLGGNTGGWPTRQGQNAGFSGSWPHRF